MGWGRLPPELRSASVPALALLPLRIFFGITFLYAGLDKLLDPAFFDANSPTSIQSQFQIFERVSPLAPLVHAAEPFAAALGILIALGEVAVGIGTLTGLAFRLAALGGAAISFLFFLTASWTTHPYYFGNDLPYAFGWLTLALAGHGNLFVLSLGRSPAGVLEQPADRTRRGLVQVGVLAIVTLLVGGGAALIRFIRNEPSPSDIGSGPTSRPTLGPTYAPSTTPSSSASPAASSGGTATPSPAATAANGLAIATISDVQGAGARRFTVPITAPAPLPAGDPAIVVALPNGTFAAFDALCTHEGCRVSYNTGSKILVCPCHGAEFDPANHAKVLGGPAPQPLLELPLVVNSKDGTIALATQ
jgi:thiosulfate dehydrogenase [quinone] large subunit